MRKLAKFLRENLLFLVILASAVVIRLGVFDYPLSQEETNRDFLIARHIAKYGEIVSFGPRNGTLPGLGNSPAYYYFLAALFSLFDNVIFVSTVNFILQIVTIVLIYLMVKRVFGKETALISALFLASAKVLTLASRWVWQPHIMYFFLILSFYILYQFYQKKSVGFLVGSIILFTFSLALHMSAFGVLPAFLVAVFLLLKARRASLRLKITILALFVFSTAIFFAPLILKAVFDYRNLTSLSAGIFVKSPVMLLANFLERITLLSTSFNPIFLGAVLLLSPFYSIVAKKDKGRKKLYFFLLGTVFSFLLVFSFLNERFFDQHLYPLYPFLTVLGAEALNRIFPSKWPLVLAKYAFAAFLALILASGVAEMRRGSYLFDRVRGANEIYENLAAEIQKIKAKENKENLDFFQFRVYSPPGRAWFEGNENIIDSIYWVLLEKRLNSQFTQVQTDNFVIRSNYRVINSDEYIFINCLNYENEQEEEDDCLVRFKAEHKEHRVLAKLPGKIHGHSFYVARK